MTLDEVRLLVVVGKGGVGRSTVAAALALRAARSGRRVLAVDTLADGGLADALGVTSDITPGVDTPLGEVAAGLVLLALDTEASLDQYVRMNLRVPLPARQLGPVARIFEFVATAAPAVREILTIGKIAHEVRRGPWDLVVVDAPASGHVVELLAAPASLGSLVGIGPLAAETEWLSALLADTDITAAVAVTTPEELPVNETIELLDRLDAETDVSVPTVVVNRIVPEVDPAGRREASAFAPGSRIAALASTAVARDDSARRERARLDQLGLDLIEVVEHRADPVGVVLEALGAPDGSR